jgi:hypothetical protein
MKNTPMTSSLGRSTAGHASAHAADDVAALLKDADRYRTGQDNLQVETQVTVFNRDGSPDKERRYTVFVQADHKSLVLMRSPAEQGQKVLMLGDDFWLLMPGSQRPLRITPSQKLLGDASTGDIATMSWSQDYNGTLAGEERARRQGAAAVPAPEPVAGAQGRDLPAHRAVDRQGAPRAGQGRSVRAVGQAREAGALRLRQAACTHDGDRDGAARPAQQPQGERVCASLDASRRRCPRPG